jgi:uncharacterized protein YbjT (DUF2867 family)
MKKRSSKPIEGEVLVTGATGYVGGRLVPRLLSSGYRVRATGRSIEKLSCRSWAGHPGVSLGAADMMDKASVLKAVEGCRVVIYLVHGMIAQDKRFIDADRKAARNMAEAAAEKGVERIIYLSGLGDVSHPAISSHLKSRHEVGEILKKSPVPVTILNAAMILGSGSASFEILRYLVERLPVMTTPRWVRTPSQPISIVNVLGYLEGCLSRPETTGQTYDIGGPEVVTYEALIHILSEEAGLNRRWILPVPVLTPYLSSLWIHLVTPVPAAIAIPLTEGLSIPTVCRENRIREIIPQRLIPCREAIAKALERIHEGAVETSWTDAGLLQPPEWAQEGDAKWAGGTLLECCYEVRLRAEPDSVWPFIQSIGGDNGYYFGEILWKARGWMDRWAGGVGLFRGRRQPKSIQVGDALDFWRVLAVDPPHRLTLLSEMKMPGEGILEIQVIPVGKRMCDIRFHSKFLPKGILGLGYWYALYPFHLWVYGGMQKALADKMKKAIVKGPMRIEIEPAEACRLHPEPVLKK